MFFKLQKLLLLGSTKEIILCKTIHKNPFAQGGDNKCHKTWNSNQVYFTLPAVGTFSCMQCRTWNYSPGGAIDPEPPHRDLGVLKVDAVGEQWLDILVVLWLQLGGRGEVVEVLLNQVSHKLLVKGQLVVSGNYYLDVIGQSAWHRRRGRSEGKEMSVKGKTVNMGEKMRMAQTEEGKIGVIEEWQGQI